VVFTAQGADLGRDAACTITTDASTVKVQATERQLASIDAPANDPFGYKCDWRFGDLRQPLRGFSSEWGFTPVAAAANKWNSPSVVNAINPPALYATSLNFAIPVNDENSPATLSFKSTTPMATGDKITVALPTAFVLSSTADGAPSLVSCGTTTLTLTQQPNAVELRLGSALSADTTCTVTTHAGTIQVKTQAGNHADYTIRAAGSVGTLDAARIGTVNAIFVSLVLGNRIKYYSSQLTIGTYARNAKTSITLQFRKLSAIPQGAKVELALPTWTLTDTATVTTADKGGCGATTFTAATSGIGANQRSPSLWELRRFLRKLRAP